MAGQQWGKERKSNFIVKDKRKSRYFSLNPNAAAIVSELKNRLFICMNFGFGERILTPVLFCRVLTMYTNEQIRKGHAQSPPSYLRYALRLRLFRRIDKLPMVFRSVTVDSLKWFFEKSRHRLKWQLKIVENEKRHLQSSQCGFFSVPKS